MGIHQEHLRKAESSSIGVIVLLYDRFMTCSLFKEHPSYSTGATTWSLMEFDHIVARKSHSS